LRLGYYKSVADQTAV